LQEQLPANFAGVTGECCCLPSTELVSERAALLVTLAKDLQCSFASTYANVSDSWWTRKHVGDVEGVTKRQLDYIAGPSTADSKSKSFNLKTWNNSDHYLVFTSFSFGYRVFASRTYNPNYTGWKPVLAPNDVSKDGVNDYAEKYSVSLADRLGFTSLWTARFFEGL